VVKVKTARITRFSFFFSIFFTQSSAHGIDSRRFATTAPVKVTAQNAPNRAGATPPCRKIAAPVPSGFGGHSRLLLLEDAARVLAAQEKGTSAFVRQHV